MRTGSRCCRTQATAARSGGAEAALDRGTPAAAGPSSRRSAGAFSARGWDAIRSGEAGRFHAECAEADGRIRTRPRADGPHRVFQRLLRAACHALGGRAHEAPVARAPATGRGPPPEPCARSAGAARELLSGPAALCGARRWAPCRVLGRRPLFARAKRTEAFRGTASRPAKLAVLPLRRSARPRPARPSRRPRRPRAAWRDCRARRRRRTCTSPTGSGSCSRC